MPAELIPLLSADPATWLGVAAQMRAAPVRARDLLLQGLAAQPQSPRRWRMAFYLGSFGRVQDVPALLATLDAKTPVLERQVILGAMQALYPVPVQPADLSRVLNDFTFQAPEPPPRAPQRATGSSPPRPLATGLTPLLLAQGSSPAQSGTTQPGPPPSVTAAAEGTLRLGLTNTEPRPILLALNFSSWLGKFDQPPDTLYQYLLPGENVRLEVPVSMTGPQPPGLARVNVRAREVNAPQNALSRKVYVPLMR